MGHQQSDPDQLKGSDEKRQPQPLGGRDKPEQNQ